MKIMVLGVDGMLGHQVYLRLKANPKFEVSGTMRDKFVKMRQYPEIKRLFGDDIRSGKILDFTVCDTGFSYNLENKDYVINCIGKIKQVTKKTDIFTNNDFYRVNSVFPWQLIKRSRRVIHITTDCVYDGFQGFYREHDKHTAADVYGLSKSLGEPVHDTMILRTSIIGPEIVSKGSFLEWITSQTDTIKGYTNHLWNGITTLQLAKVIEQIILEKKYHYGIFHIHMPETLSKYQMAKKINEIFDLGLRIQKFKTPQFCYRNLSTLRPRLLSEFNIPTFNQMAEELKEQCI